MNYKRRKHAYCTLFDSNYADKGLVMIDSLLEKNDSETFVLCMDDLCFDIIKGERFPNVIGIPLHDFMDKELFGIVNERSRGEFCWSCTGKLIKYVLDNYEYEYCTYVDSDLYFYDNPDSLIEEMVASECSVQVVPHRYPDTKFWKSVEAQSGANCVQFNTFSNENKSRELLDEWIDKCIDKCSYIDGGDQKYTSQWGELPYVNISKNEGAGVAPWNIQKYKLDSINPIIIKDRKTQKKSRVIFYHFQGIEYNDRRSVNIRVRNRIEIIDMKLIRILYTDYLEKIERKKSYLSKKYNVLPMYSHSSGLLKDKKNNLKSFKAIIYWVITYFNTKLDTLYLSSN